MSAKYKETLARLKENDVKIYVKDISEVPQGYEPLTGPRGGVYYIADSKDAVAKDDKKTDDTDKSAKDQEQKTIPKPTPEQEKDRAEKQRAINVELKRYTNENIKKLSDEEIKKVFETENLYIVRDILSKRKVSEDAIDTILNSSRAYTMIDAFSEQELSEKQIDRILSDRSLLSDEMKDILKHQKLNKKQIEKAFELIKSKKTRYWNSMLSVIFENQQIDSEELQHKSLELATELGHKNVFFEKQSITKEIIEELIKNDRDLWLLLETQDLSNKDIEDIRSRLDIGMIKTQDITNTLLRNPRLNDKIYDDIFDNFRLSDNDTISLIIHDRNLTEDQTKKLYEFAKQEDARYIVNGLIQNKPLSSELQSRIIDDFGERQKEALLDYQKLDESVLDKLMSDKEFLKEHQGSLFETQNLSSAQLKSMIDNPDIQTPLITKKTLDDETVKYLLENLDLDVTEVNTVFRTNALSKDTIDEFLNNKKHIYQISKYQKLNREQRDKIYDIGAQDQNYYPVIADIYEHQKLDRDEIDRAIISGKNLDRLLRGQELDYPQIDAVLEVTRTGDSDREYNKILQLCASLQIMSDDQLKHTLQYGNDEVASCVYKYQKMNEELIDLAIAIGNGDMKYLYGLQILSESQINRAISSNINYLSTVYETQKLTEKQVLAAIKNGNVLSTLYNDAKKLEITDKIINAAIDHKVSLEYLLHRNDIGDKLKKEQIKRIIDLGIEEQNGYDDILSAKEFDTELLNYCINNNYMLFDICADKKLTLDDIQIDKILSHNGDFITRLIDSDKELSKDIIENVLSKKYVLNSNAISRFFYNYKTKIASERITELIKNAKTHSDSEMLWALYDEYDALTDEQINLAIEKGIGLSTLIRNNYAAFTDEQIDKLIDIAPVGMDEIYEHRELTEEQVERAINVGASLFYLYSRPYNGGNKTVLTEKNITSAILREKDLDRLYEGYRDKLTDKHIDLIISGDKQIPKLLDYGAYIHLSEDQINQLLTKDTDVIESLIRNYHGDLTESQLDKIIDMNNLRVLELAVYYKKFSENQCSKILNSLNFEDSSNKSIIEEIIAGQKLKQSDISMLIDNADSINLERLVTRQKLNSDNIKKILSTKSDSLLKSLFSWQEKLSDEIYSQAIDNGVALYSLYYNKARHFSQALLKKAITKGESLDALFNERLKLDQDTKNLALDKLLSVEYLNSASVDNVYQSSLLHFLANQHLSAEETERAFDFIVKNEDAIINKMVRDEKEAEDPYDRYDDDNDDDEDINETTLDEIFGRLEMSAKKYKLPILSEIRKRIIPEYMHDFKLIEYTSNRKILESAYKLYESAIEKKERLKLARPINGLVGTYQVLDTSDIRSIMKSRTEFKNRDQEYVITIDDYDSVESILQKNKYEINYENTKYAKKTGIEKPRDISIGSIFQSLIKNNLKKINALDKNSDAQEIAKLSNENEQIQSAIKSFAKIQQYEIKDPSDLEIIISNSPMDMLRKSTTQDWRTCERALGEYREGVISDIAGNHLIAYVRKKGTSNWLSRSIIRWGEDEDGKTNAVVERGWGINNFYENFVKKSVDKIVRSQGYSAGFNGSRKMKLPIEHSGYVDNGSHTHYYVVDRPDKDEIKELSLKYKKLKDTFEESVGKKLNMNLFFEAYVPENIKPKMFDFYTKMFRKVAELYMPKNNETKKESIHFRERLSSILQQKSEKYRIYVGTIGEAPPGVQLLTGPHGGKYYYSDEPEEGDKKKDPNVDQNDKKWSDNKLRDVDKNNKDVSKKSKKFKPTDFEYYKLLKMSFQELQEAIKERKYLNYIYRTQRLYPENIDLAIETGLYLDILYKRHELSAGQIEKAIAVGDSLRELYDYQDLSDEQKNKVKKILKTKKETFRSTLSALHKGKPTLDDVAFKTFRQKFLNLSEDERRQCIYVYANWTDEY